MRSTLLAGAALASSLLVGCPNPPECSETVACADGLLCQEGACVASTGDGTGGGGICRDTSKPSAPNVLDNPGFECGTQGWEVNVVRPGKLEHEAGMVRSGSGAAKLTVTNGVVELMQLAAVENPEPQSVWCAYAWMRGTTSDGRLTILRDQDGFVVDESFNTPVVDNEWSRAPASFPLKITVGPQDKKLYLSVKIQNPKVGDYLIVDDVALWQSKGGDCSER
jgi:hypothetical protein